MGFNKWANKKSKNLSWIDMALVKLAVFSFALFIAKIWMPILNLEWYWYAIMFVLFAIKPVFKFFKK